MDVIKEKPTTKLISVGVGKYERVEYIGGAVVLRNFDIKEVDRGGRIQIYFDANDEQVMTGRRFDIVGDRLILRAGMVYRVNTNIIIGEEYPAKDFKVELTQDAKDVVGLLNYTAKHGERVTFTMLVFHTMEIEKMVSLAGLHVGEFILPHEPIEVLTNPENTSEESTEEIVVIQEGPDDSEDSSKEEALEDSKEDSPVEETVEAPKEEVTTSTPAKSKGNKATTSSRTKKSAGANSNAKGNKPIAGKEKGDAGNVPKKPSNKK